jgi:hypothetical protein
VVALPVLLMAGFAAWLFLFTLDESDAETSDITATVVTAPAPEGAQGRIDAAAPPQAAVEPAAAEPLQRLRISSQSFRRGGLGSKALMTFTLRNDNDYAVKDLEILCSFRSRDGRYSTERRRTINDTVNTKSRKTFPSTLVGFVNIKASKAKCSLLTASRV